MSWHLNAALVNVRPAASPDGDKPASVASAWVREGSCAEDRPADDATFVDREAMQVVGRSAILSGILLSF
jgi:hypothetical protein